MDEKQRQQLVKGVHQATMDGRIPWERTIEHDVFAARFDGVELLAIHRLVDERTGLVSVPRRFGGRRPARHSDWYGLSVLREKSAVTDMITEETVGLWLGSVEQGRHILAAIHDGARRHVEKADSAIDAFLDELSPGDRGDPIAYLKENVG